MCSQTDDKWNTISELRMHLVFNVLSGTVKRPILTIRAFSYKLCHQTMESRLIMCLLILLGVTKTNWILCHKKVTHMQRKAKKQAF